MQVSLQAFKNWVYSNPSQAAQTLDQATTVFKAIVAAEIAGVGYFYSSLSKKTICIAGAISFATGLFLVYTRNWIAKVEEEQPKKSEKNDNKGNLPLHHEVNNAPQVEKERINTFDDNGYTLLHHAVIDAPQVEKEQKERINDFDDKGNLPLHHDVNNTPQVEKERINTFDDNGYTLLHHAVIDAPIEKIKSLLEQGADFRAKVEKKDESQENNWGNTPLHFAARHGRLDVVTLLLEKECNVLEENTNGENSIHMAGDAGWKEIFDLLKQNANIEDDDYAVFYDVFDLAKYGYLENLKLHMGKDVNNQTRDEDGFTLLHHAAKRGELDTVKYLVGEGTDKEAKTPDNLTPYMLAYRNGWNEVTEFLKSHGCSTDLGTTTFIWKDLAGSSNAVYDGRYKYGANPLGKDAQDKTALHYLSRSSEVKAILELDTSLAITVDQTGNTPLHLVQTVASFELLYENGALIDLENQWGQTPLNCALEQGNLEVAKALLDRKAKLNASATNEKGEPFLHCFIRKDKKEPGIELLKQLFAIYAVNFELRNSKSETCLHVAADQYDQRFVILLLERDPNLINLTDHLGQTALHRAYYSESRRKILIEAGADLSLKDNEDLTPENLYNKKRSEEIQRERAQHKALNSCRSNW